MLNIDEVKSYLRIDGDYDDALILDLISAADEYVEDAVGTLYDVDSARAKLLKLFVIRDLYDGESKELKVGSIAERRVADFVLQLQMRGRADDAT